MSDNKDSPGKSTHEDFQPGGVLNVTEVAKLLHCSKAHVCNAINGKVRGVTPLPAISMGRRKLVRRQSLEAWLSQNDPTPTGGNMGPSHPLTP
jgi:excisionase family DNA binding protein